MKTLVLMFLLGIGGVTAVTHSLKYFYTASSGVPNFPEFVAVGMVDEMQMVHYDSNTMKAVPKQDWMNEVITDDPQYLERNTGKCQGDQQNFKANIEIAKQRFNQTGGAHIVQYMYGCEWDDETHEVNGFRQFGYDGEDFLVQDVEREAWVAPVQQALPTKMKWDHDRSLYQMNKVYITQECPEWLKKYVNYGRRFLMRKELPSVSLLQKTSSSPVTCHATGFYPDRADLVWMKDGEELHEDVEKGEILPNHDGTFQMSVDLKVSSIAPEDWKKYDCVFQLSGVKDDINTKLDKAVIRTNRGFSTVETFTWIIAIPAALAVVILVLIAVVGFVIYKKKNRVPAKDMKPSPETYPTGSLARKSEKDNFSSYSDSYGDSVNSITPLVKDMKTSPNTSSTGSLTRTESDTLSSCSSRDSVNSDEPLMKDMKTSPETSPTGSLTRTSESETLSICSDSSRESVSSDTPLIKDSLKRK